MNKKIISSAVAIGLILTLNTAVIADSVSDEIDRQNSVISKENDTQSNLNNSLQKYQSSRKAVQANVEKLDSQIGAMISDLNTVKANIAKTTSDIAIAQKDLDKAEADIKDEQQLYDDRMRAMYKNGGDSYISILLSSNGFSDFLDKIGMIKSIVEFDKKLIADLNAKKEDINKRKQALDAQNVSLLSLKADSEAKLSKLNATSNSLKQQMAQYKQLEYQYADQIAASEKKVAAAKLAMQRLASSSVIVAYASTFVRSSTFVGCPYVWGGNGELITTNYINNLPNYVLQHFYANGISNPSEFLSHYNNNKSRAFDCSGFVTYVFKNFGISFGGGRPTTWTMIAYGTPVTRANLQPGDVVYFDNNNHVGIYYGGGCVIDAPLTGGLVRIEDMDNFDFYAARRM